MKKFLIFVGILVAIAATGFYFSVASATGAYPYVLGGTGSSTIPAKGQVFYAGPTSWQSVATTTTACSGTVSCASFTVLDPTGHGTFTITGSGGSGSGLSTTSPLSAGNILVYSATGAGSAFGAATTTLGGTGVVNVSNSPVVVGSTPSVVSLTGGTNGQVLGWLSGVPTWTASSSVAVNTPLTITTSGAVTTISCASCNTTSSNVIDVVNSDGTLTISPTTGHVIASIALAHANTWTGLQQFYANASSTQESVTQAYFGGTATTTFTTANGEGIGSSTPSVAGLTLDRSNGFASSTIVVYEYRPATSTAATLNCNTGIQTHYRIGFSATTLTLTGLIPGQTCRVVIENPNGTAGALTWAAGSGYILLWAGGTTPTQTTTANKQDVWSFLATQGSSTIDILGTQVANF